MQLFFLLPALSLSFLRVRPISTRLAQQHIQQVPVWNPNPARAIWFQSNLLTPGSLKQLLTCLPVSAHPPHSRTARGIPPGTGKTEVPLGTSPHPYSRPTHPTFSAFLQPPFLTHFIHTGVLGCCPATLMSLQAQATALTALSSPSPCFPSLRHCLLSQVTLPAPRSSPSYLSPALCNTPATIWLRGLAH